MRFPAAFSRLERIEREFRAAQLGLARLESDAARDSRVTAERGLAPSEVRMARERLEQTYVVRMFAEFEATLRRLTRRLWPPAGLGRRGIKTIMDRLAARLYIVNDVLADAHSVRKFRNQIVHNAELTAELPLATCRSRLARFVSYAPQAMLD